MSDAPAIPRPAATVILMRKGGRHDSQGLEVLLAQRNPGSRFMPGVWVFPGGSIGEEDGAPPGASTEEIPELAYRTGALRELEEEVGLSLGGPEDLALYSRWITPEMV